MEINTLYPEEFDAGIMLGLFDKFKPKDAFRQPNIRVEKKQTGLLYILTW